MPHINVTDLSFVPAYLSKSKCGIRGTKEVRRKTGVYFIKEDGELIYIGMSKSCVYNALYRHFQHWVAHDRTRHKHKRLTYKHWLKKHKYEVAIVYLEKEIVDHVERFNIGTYRPRDNKWKYDNYTTSTTNFTEDFNKELTENNIHFKENDDYSSPF